MSIPLPLQCPCVKEGNTAPCQRTAWYEIAGRYPEPRQCVAAFLTLGTAEVIAGVKPANLLRISNRAYSCGRNMYKLWQQHGEELLANSSLVAATLLSDTNGVLLLIYSPALLQRRLNSRSARTFLASLDYRDPQHLETTLADLVSHFVDGEFPHEIGLFLGYPLKDISAFMGRSQLEVTAQRLWKIYGKTRRSHALADLYQHQHQRIVSLLNNKRGRSAELLTAGVL
ncbi:MAG: DUF3793 family protein [Desulfuromonas sp.]|nr:DUF3793 family protein [Desulfuromonas sp.]